jgi:hypothetical protein
MDGFAFGEIGIRGNWLAGMIVLFFVFEMSHPLDSFLQDEIYSPG